MENSNFIFFFQLNIEYSNYIFSFQFNIENSTYNFFQFNFERSIYIRGNEVVKLKIFLSKRSIILVLSNASCLAH